ncbi:hypothetical protein JYB64_01915 [Algoriphagus aestuarii]|nr:hypothetical protein [Algoriphagus aestuarii]
MKKVKYFAIAGSLCLMFGISIFPKVKAQSSNYRIYRSGEGWYGCYEPGGNCYSEDPFEEKDV